MATMAAVIVGSFNSTTSGLPKPTIIRTRGIVSVAPSVNNAADVDIVGAWGFCIVSDNAFDIGITAVPLPFDDAGWDGWFAWGSFSQRWDVVGMVGQLELTSRDTHVDSKGMRKVGSEETVILAAQSQVGAFGISMPLRLLVKIA